ncbi:acyltransferase [Pseudoalteromonas luteoviolacea]|uniref:acyltransferase n=1 Tax=Pseudoalteromonas luteoviolacea TaxID=43657 RepID=UPI001B39A6B7|nr:acyltransferase [Pseudoalteromonas luteoviolacea]MBQ4812064.1 acyltransferase [Pseudoalteromonas luteoviolacea]
MFKNLTRLISYALKFRRIDKSYLTINIGKNIRLYYPGKVQHEGYLHLNDDNFIDARGGVDFGKNVILAPKVCILTYNHDYDNVDWVPYSPKIIMKGVEIGQDCWIGYDSLLLPGTKLGNNTVVAAKSVLKGSYPDNVLIAGNPAKVIKALEKSDDAKQYLIQKFGGIS